MKRAKEGEEVQLLREVELLGWRRRVKKFNFSEKLNFWAGEEG
jgi:hypothetical protein